MDIHNFYTAVFGATIIILFASMFGAVGWLILFDYFNIQIPLVSDPPRPKIKNTPSNLTDEEAQQILHVISQTVSHHVVDVPTMITFIEKIGQASDYGITPVDIFILLRQNGIKIPPKDLSKINK